MRNASSGRLNCALLALKKSVTSCMFTSRPLLIDHLLREQVAAELSFMSTSVGLAPQFFLKVSSGCRSWLRRSPWEMASLSDLQSNTAEQDSGRWPVQGVEQRCWIPPTGPAELGSRYDFSMVSRSSAINGGHVSADLHGPAGLLRTRRSENNGNNKVFHRIHCMRSLRLAVRKDQLVDAMLGLFRVWPSCHGLTPDVGFIERFHRLPDLVHPPVNKSPIRRSVTPVSSG